MPPKSAKPCYALRKTRKQKHTGGQSLKIASPQAEVGRAEQRHIDYGLIMKARAKYDEDTYYMATGNRLVILNLLRRLEAGQSRETQYLRIIKSMGKPKKAKACRTCAVRKLRIAKRTKEKPANVAECRKIIASIEECWPGWRKVPELLWNQYIDSAGHCRCGRVIAPKLVSKSANVRFCCSEHRQNEMTKKNRARRKEYAIASKALAEGME
jgi:hypothetical protein